MQTTTSRTPLSSPKPKQHVKATIREKFQILITCRDEADQRLLFERMKREERLCRVLVI